MTKNSMCNVVGNGKRVELPAARNQVQHPRGMRQRHARQRSASKWSTWRRKKASRSLSAKTQCSAAGAWSDDTPGSAGARPVNDTVQEGSRAAVPGMAASEPVSSAAAPPPVAVRIRPVLAPGGNGDHPPLMQLHHAREAKVPREIRRSGGELAGRRPLLCRV